MPTARWPRRRCARSARMTKATGSKARRCGWRPRSIAQPGELPALLVDALGDRSVALFVALLAHRAAARFRGRAADRARAGGDRCGWRCARSSSIARRSPDRAGAERRDVEAFADQLDAIAAVEPADARAALAPLALPPDFRAAMRRAGGGAMSDRAAPVHGLVDRDGRLVEAGGPLDELNARAGGAIGAAVRGAAGRDAGAAGAAARHHRVARTCVAADGPDDVELWVRAEPVGEGVRLAISGWRVKAPWTPPVDPARRDRDVAARRRLVVGDRRDAAPDRDRRRGRATASIRRRCSASRSTRCSTLEPDAAGRDADVRGAAGARAVRRSARDDPRDRRARSCCRRGRGSTTAGKFAGYVGAARTVAAAPAPPRTPDGEALTEAFGARLERALRAAARPDHRQCRQHQRPDRRADPPGLCRLCRRHRQRRAASAGAGRRSRRSPGGRAARFRARGRADRPRRCRAPRRRAAQRARGRTRACAIDRPQDDEACPRPASSGACCRSWSI